MTVAVNPSGLEPGTHDATLTVCAEGAAGSPQTTAVTLTIGEAAPVVVRTPASLAFSGVEGGANPASQTLQGQRRSS